MDIRLGVFGPEHPDVANSYNNLGSVYYSQGDYAKAVDFFNKALDIRLGVFGPEHPDVANSYNNLGCVYYSQGDYAKAEEFYNKALDIRLHVFGLEHPDVANSYNNLGSVHDSQGEYAKAEEFHNKALDILLGVFGPEHPDVAISYNNLGDVYVSQGDYAKAVEYYNKALDIQIRVFGPEHPDVATSYCNLGLVYSSQGDYDNAEEFYNKALGILERSPDVDSTSLTNFYQLYIDSLIKCTKSDQTVMTELFGFMANKLWFGSITGEDTPAAEKGLSGEYYILEFGDWNFTRDYDLLSANKTLQGQPKSLVIMQADDIERYDFENRIGMQLSLRKVTLEEKARAVEAYRRWKSENGEQ